MAPEESPKHRLESTNAATLSAVGSVTVNESVFSHEAESVMVTVYVPIGIKSFKLDVTPLFQL